MDGEQDGDWERKVLPTVRKDLMYDSLRNLNIHKLMRPDKMHPRVLTELADAVPKSLSMTFEKLRHSGQVQVTGKRGNMVPIFKKARN